MSKPNLVEIIKKEKWYISEIERSIMAFYSLNTNDIQGRTQLHSRIDELKLGYKELTGRPYISSDRHFL